MATEAIGAEEQQTHEPTEGEAAQPAAESPKAELAGQAQSAQVASLERAETPAFDAAGF